MQRTLFDVTLWGSLTAWVITIASSWRSSVSIAAIRSLLIRLCLLPVVICAIVLLLPGKHSGHGIVEGFALGSVLAGWLKA